MQVDKIVYIPTKTNEKSQLDKAVVSSSEEKDVNDSFREKPINKPI